jgi:hypothetical protein
MKDGLFDTMIPPPLSRRLYLCRKAPNSGCIFDKFGEIRMFDKEGTFSYNRGESRGMVENGTCSMSARKMERMEYCIPGNLECTNRGDILIFLKRHRLVEEFLDRFLLSSDMNAFVFGRCDETIAKYGSVLLREPQENIAERIAFKNAWKLMTGANWVDGSCTRVSQQAGQVHLSGGIADMSLKVVEFRSSLPRRTENHSMTAALIAIHRAMISRLND